MFKPISRRFLQASAVEGLEDRRLLSASGAALAHPAGAIRGVVNVSLQATTIGIVHAADPSAVSAELQAVADWGDGSTPGIAAGAFTVDPAHPNTIDFAGNHTYSKAGVYRLTLGVSENGQSLGTIHETVRIAANSSNGHTIHAVAGQEFLADLGTLPAVGITSANVSIDWGDSGFTGTAMVRDAGPIGGAITGPTIVSGLHTYDTAGTYQVAVAVGSSPDPQAVITDSVIVAAAKHPLSKSAVHTLVIPPSGEYPIGQSISSNLAAITGLPASITDVSAKINWGDGSAADVVDESISGGTATANAQHTYATGGTYLVTGSFVNTANGKPIGQPFQERLQIGNISPGGVTLSATTGTPFDGVVGTFTMSPAPTMAGIDWGDGFHSYGTIKALGHNQYQISGSHTYSSAGTYPVSITGAVNYDPYPPTSLDGSVGSQDGYTGYITSQMKVTGAYVPLVSPNVTVTPLTAADVGENATFTAALATMTGYPTDADTAANVYARIDWGEGLVSGSNPYYPTTEADGTYTATASHAYNIDDPTPHTYTVTVDFVKKDASANSGYDELGSTTTTITVLPTNTPGGVTLNLTTNAPFSGVVGNVTSFDTQLPPTTIDWGDGTTSTDFTTRPQSDGSLQVSAAHTYLKAGSYRIVIENVNAPGGSVTDISEYVDSLAVVTDPTPT